MNAQNKAKLKYRKNKVKRITIDFYINTEQDLIAKLDSVPSKATYIKKLIRKDL